MDRPRTHSLPDAAGAWRISALIIALFLIAALPFALRQILTENVDEPRYTYAAAKMIETGNYLVPVNPWGGDRLLKPPLAYYYVVAGFKFFGQSLFGAKAFWLLTGAAILALTHLLARIIGATPLGAALAVAGLAANLIFFRTAITHIPDALLLFGVTLALTGFARILKGAPPGWAYYAAWLGLAFGILSKGLFPLVVLALGLGARLLARGISRPSGHELLAIALAVPLALSWYLAVYLAAPATFIAQFFGDQLTDKAAFDPANAANFLKLNIYDLFRYFLPLLMLLPVAPWGRLFARPGAPVLFLLIYVAAVPVLFSLSNFRSERYMLFAMPPLAALLGLWIGARGWPGLAGAVRWTIRILSLFPLLIGVLTAGLVYAEHGAVAALACLVATLAVLVFLWKGAARARPLLPVVLLAILPTWSILGAFPGYSILAVPSDSEIAAAEIRKAGLSADEVTLLWHWQFVERIGLIVPPMVDYNVVIDLTPEAVAGTKMVIARRKSDEEALRVMGFDVYSRRGVPGNFSIGELAQAVRAQDLDALRQEHGGQIYFAVPAAPAR